MENNDKELFESTKEFLTLAEISQQVEWKLLCDLLIRLDAINFIIQNTGSLLDLDGYYLNIDQRFIVIVDFDIIHIHGDVHAFINSSKNGMLGGFIIYKILPCYRARGIEPRSRKIMKRLCLGRHWPYWRWMVCRV
jgi:hypothetical protein